MVESRSVQLLEIYKLHTKLADRVSQRREGANRLYAGLLVAFATFIIALIRFSIGPHGEEALLIEFAVAGIVGMGLSLSWFLVIRSYRQLNTGKFRALQEIEKQLDFEFLSREWELLREGRDFRTYWKLTVAESILPVMFGLLSLALIVITLCRYGV